MMTTITGSHRNVQGHLQGPVGASGSFAPQSQPGSRGPRDRDNRGAQPRDRAHKALITLALGLALAGATTAVAAAATPPTGLQDQADQQKAPYQSQLDTTLARHRALGALSVQESVAQCQALSQSEQERSLARHRALGAIAAPPAIAAQPVAKTTPAAPDPGVDVPATLLVGLVGGLLGGAAVMVGWTATTRRRRPRAATGLRLGPPA
jgi:hypothetical protein